jgi:transposase
MEWLLDIVPSHGLLAARLALPGALTEVVSFDDVHKRGLPNVSTNFHTRVHVDFSEFTATDASKELALLGLQLPRDFANRHESFEVFIQGRRLVVPCLALMREIFAPSRFLLAEMVKPQALDRVSRTTLDGTLVMDAPWAVHARGLRLRDCSKALRWMHDCASARTMANSVHINALYGLVALALPKGKADMTLNGVDFGHSVLVLDVRLKSIRPSDSPQIGMNALHECIQFRGRPPQSGEANSFLSAKHCHVHRHTNGSIEVSDEEWTKVQQLFSEAGMLRDRKGTLDRRMLLDGVLLKINTRVAWRNATYSTGNWQNASAAFREWNRSGVFDQILACLHNTRAAKLSVLTTELVTQGPVQLGLVTDFNVDSSSRCTDAVTDFNVGLGAQKDLFHSGRQ